VNVFVLYNNKSTLIKIDNIIKALERKVKFKYFNINTFYKNNIFLNKKFQDFIIKKNPDVVFDLLPAADSSLKNNKYLEFIKKIYKIRISLKNSNVKTLKVSYSWLNKYDVSPYRYFLYIRNLFFYLKNLFLKDIYKFNKTDFTILSSLNCENNEKYFNTKKFYYKHFDYHLKKVVKKTKKKRLVYIDQYLYAHPDLLINGVRFIKKKIFSKEIQSLFSKLEKKGYKIDVALHPKNNSKDYKEVYGNRNFLKNKTFNLVAQSSGIISHDSTAINFAVQVRKPILFVTSNELKNSRFGHRIESHAKFFKSIPINISQKEISINEIHLSKIKKKIYINYERKFLKHEKFNGNKNFVKNFFKIIL